MKIYNTYSKKKEILVPLENKHIKLFVCGPTVYNFAHMGHAKTYTQFDFIVRYLRYKGFKVFYLQNITDIDDKILNRAKEVSAPWKEIAQKYEENYLEDMQNLHNSSVTEYVRATDQIKHIVNQVKTLLDKGYAYKIKDGIYFEISKFQDYGKLSGRVNLRENDALSRIDENREKRGWNDFCLWKFSKSGEPAWETELGTGRPGWHIEDTAITEKYFGPQYDIHGGAIDLIIPHHEAEIAQMEAASGKKPLVKYWMHTGFLNINNEKMSKSKGNFFTIKEVLKKYNYRVLRFLFLSSHYRSPLDYNDTTLMQAKEALQRIDEFIFNIKKPYLDDVDNLGLLDKLKIKVLKDIDNDFNTPAALAKIFDFIKQQNIRGKAGKNILDFFKEMNSLFDFINFEPELNMEVEMLLSERNKCRLEGKYQEADEIRIQLEQKGVKIYDSKNKTTWRKV